jgi:hypothetical protein
LDTNQLIKQLSAVALQSDIALYQVNPLQVGLLGRYLVMVVITLNA